MLAENLEISRFVHGYWRLNDWNLGKDQCLNLIKETLAMGITTFDHADIYGSYTCEKLFGETLKLEPGLRKEIEIITKCGIVLKSPNRPLNNGHHYNTSKSHIIKSAEISLKNFGTDYIDLLLIHRPDPFMDPHEVAEAFSDLKKSGKVRNFGVSNFLPHQYQMLQSYMDEKLITNQVEISAWNLENMENGVLDFALEKRIKPMAWSPLGGGYIFKSNEEKALRLRKTLEEIKMELGAKKIDQVMYAWLLSHPGGIIPIIGSGNLGRVELACESIDYKLTRAQWFRIYDASRGREVD